MTKGDIVHVYVVENLQCTNQMPITQAEVDMGENRCNGISLLITLINHDSVGAERSSQNALDVVQKHFKHWLVARRCNHSSKRNKIPVHIMRAKTRGRITILVQMVSFIHVANAQFRAHVACKCTLPFLLSFFLKKHTR
jgi:hypothetical protein